MVVYGLYIFDRHCTCTFYASFNGKPPKQGPSTLPNVYTPPSSSALRDSSSTTQPDRSSTGPIPPWHLPGSHSGLLVSQGTSGGDEAEGEGASETKPGLAFDEEAKLVYGIVFSLRNMVNKLAGTSDDSFHSFSTSAYKLHYLRSPTSTHFVLVTSPTPASYRNVLRQIHTGPFTEFVVRNPAVELDSAVSGRGIDNDAFRTAVAKMVAGMQ